MVSLGVRGKWSNQDRAMMSAQRKNHSIAENIMRSMHRHMYNHTPQSDAMGEINNFQQYTPNNEDAHQNTPCICRDCCYLHKASTRILQLCHRDEVAHQDI